MSEILQVLQLRKAGGKYYLIDNENAGMPYHKPIVVNEAGAEIFTQLTAGNSKEEAAHNLADEYGVELALIEKDIEDFLADLKSRHRIWQ